MGETVPSSAGAVLRARLNGARSAVKGVAERTPIFLSDGTKVWCGPARSAEEGLLTWTTSGWQPIIGADKGPGSYITTHARAGMLESSAPPGLGDDLAWPPLAGKRRPKKNEPFFVGMFLAEGTFQLGPKKGHGAFEISSVNTRLLEPCQEYLSSQGVSHYVRTDAKPSPAGNKRVHRLGFNLQGLCCCYSGNATPGETFSYWKIIPPYVYGWDRAAREEMVTAYLYGDGELSQQRPVPWQWSTASPTLAQGVMWLMHSLKPAASFGVYRHSNGSAIRVLENKGRLPNAVKRTEGPARGQVVRVQVGDGDLIAGVGLFKVAVAE